MNWPILAITLWDFVEEVPSPKWLALAASGASVVLLGGLIALSDRYLRLRRRVSELGEPSLPAPGAGAAGWEDELPPISLEGERRAPVDRLLPRQPHAFLIAVCVLAAACWAAGLALTEDVWEFLTSREWQLQPLYLAAHFITLRLFATMFTRNYLAGVVHLDMPTAHARRGIELVMGPTGTLIAVLVALPFMLYDYQLVGLPKVAKAAGAGLAVDRLLYGIWCIEWYLMALIWVQLVGFLFLTRRAIGNYRFRAPIEVVLLEKQYRHFLALSAHGATIVLGFFLVNLVYSWYTGAELTDYIGVTITLVLLVVGFIPPWIQLTAKMDRIIKDEMARLRRRLASSELLRPVGAVPSPGPGASDSAADLQARLDEALVMLRISYLERLHRDLGNMEAWSIVMKVGVPVMTVVYYAVHIFRTS
jgi:hypothetical protein